MRKQTKATFPFIELHGSKNRWLCVVKLSHIGLCLSKRTKKSGILRIEKFNTKHNGMNKQSWHLLIAFLKYLVSGIFSVWYVNIWLSLILFLHRLKRKPSEIRNILHRQSSDVFFFSSRNLHLQNHLKTRKSYNNYGFKIILKLANFFT